MKWPKDFINKIICGDAVDVMKKIPDGAVDPETASKMVAAVNGLMRRFKKDTQTTTTVCRMRNM